MEKIEDVVGLPAINKSYLVPTVVSGGNTRWPVIGPPHNDKRYFPKVGEHYHVDVRFLSSAQMLMHLGIEGVFSLPERRPHMALIVVLVIVADPLSVLEKTEPTPFRCYRQMPEFPTFYTGPTPTMDRPNKQLARMEDDYARTRIKPGCAICPHRRMPLNGIPSKDGVVVCPGHGLAWDLKTGEMVRRVTK
jgi:hypothetical protein